MDVVEGIFVNVYFILLAQYLAEERNFARMLLLRKIRMVYGIINATKDSINGI